MVVDDKDILKAIKILMQNSDIEDKLMLSIFEGQGIPNRVANYLLLFVPLAFSRIVCKDFNINFTNEYIEHYRNGKAQEGILTENQIFLQVYKLSEKFIKSGLDSAAILDIASRSHEFKLVNDALRKGSETNTLKFSTIHFLLDADV